MPICRKYKCYIQIEDEEKKFLINPPKFEVVAKKFSLEQGRQKAPEPKPDPVPGINTHYQIFVMAFYSTKVNLLTETFSWLWPS